MSSPTVAPPGACLIIEDRPDTLAWLKDVVALAFPGMATASAGSLREAYRWLSSAEADAGPTLALVDLGLPDGSGVELIGWLNVHRPGCIPVVTTIYDDDLHLFDSLAAGAQGYLLKTGDTEMMAAALKRIEGGEPPLSPSIARRMLERLRPPAQAKPDPAGLTGREVEVLTLLARGLTVAETAAALDLKPQTVASYVKTIYQKLNVSNRAGAVIAAAERGLT